MKTPWYKQDPNVVRHINEHDALVREAGLHIKWPEQIANVFDATRLKLETRLLKAESDHLNYPGYFQKQYVDSGMSHEEAVVQVVADTENAVRRVLRAKNILALCPVEYGLRLAMIDRGLHPPTPAKYQNGNKMFVPMAKDLPIDALRSPVGTTYYIDPDTGNDANDGLGTGTPWDTLANFTTTTVRTAGDICLVKRGTTAYAWDASGALAVDEDGTDALPIIIRSAYGNEYGDDVDLSVTATATLTMGSTTVTFSVDVSGVLAAGDWIYNVQDDQYLYSYLVLSVSTVTVIIAWPYLGDNPGSGKTMTKMLSAAPIGADSAAGAWVFNGDDYWTVQGFKGQSNNNGGLVAYQSGTGLLGRDVYIVGTTSANTVAFGVGSGLPGPARIDKVYATKGRGVSYFAGNQTGVLYTNIVQDLDNVSSLATAAAVGGAFALVENFSTTNQHASASFFGSTAGGGASLRNVVKDDTFDGSSFTASTSRTGIEDIDGVAGTNVYYALDTAYNTPIIQKTTSVTRPGGSSFSLLVTPTASLTTRMLILPILNELGIYLPANAKTLTVYARSTATTDWTADPTAPEFFLELSYYCNASNCWRKRVFSTSLADFNGTTDWQALSVTVTPAQAGNAYLSLKYGKAKESGKANTFYVDPLVVIS